MSAKILLLVALAGLMICSFAQADRDSEVSPSTCPIRNYHSDNGQTSRIETSATRYVIMGRNHAFVVNDKEVDIYDQQGQKTDSMSLNELENGSNSRSREYQAALKALADTKPVMTYDNSMIQVDPYSSQGRHSMSVLGDGTVVMKEPMVVVNAVYRQNRVHLIVLRPRTVIMVDSQCQLTHVDMNDREFRELMRRIHHQEGPPGPPGPPGPHPPYGPRYGPPHGPPPMYGPPHRPTGPRLSGPGYGPDAYHVSRGDLRLHAPHTVRAPGDRNNGNDDMNGYDSPNDRRRNRFHRRWNSNAGYDYDNQYRYQYNNNHQQGQYRRRQNNNNNQMDQNYGQDYRSPTDVNYEQYRMPSNVEYPIVLIPTNEGYAITAT